MFTVVAMAAGGTLAAAGPAAAGPVVTVVATIGVDDAPASVALTPDGAKAYVPVAIPCQNAFSTAPSKVDVIDTVTKAVAKTIAIPGSGHDAVVSGDGSRVYVTDGADTIFPCGLGTTIPTNLLSVIDTATDTVIANYPTGANPQGVALSPDGTQIYVANGTDNTVTVINTATGTTIATLPVGQTPVGVAVSPDGAKVYVANVSDGTVSVISTLTLTVSATFPAGLAPQWIALTPSGAKAYVSQLGGTSITVIATASNTVSNIPVGSTPSGVAVSPDGAHAYVGNTDDGSLSVIDTATDTVTATAGYGGQPAALAVSPDGTRVYSPDSDIGHNNTNHDTVTVLSVQFTSAAPTVTGISPASGPLTAGTPVTVTGTNLAGATAVTFGADGPATGVSCAATACTALAPAGGVGAVDVTVTTPGGISATSSADRYTYRGVPTITSVDVHSGPAAGGTIVTISGAANMADATVTFGTTPATATCTLVHCTATSPPGVAGTTVDIRLTTPGGTSAIISIDRFTYLAAPAVTGISPNTGPPAGGNPVTVTGTGLTGATITFGTTAATGVSCTDTACTATAPPGTAGTTVDVHATTAGGTSATSPADHYTWAAADLAVTLTADGDPGLLFAHIYYTITITNNGPSPVSSATVTAPLPTPMTATSPDCTVGTGPTVTCAVGTLAVGASTTRHFTVPIGLLTLNHAYTVTATRTAGTPVDLSPANDHATRTCTILTSLILSCR